MTPCSLTLWDSSDEPSDTDGIVYRWSGYAQADPVYSLLAYIETHAERLRRKYLAWIHDLGESRISGRRLVDRLALTGGQLSYWWMTLLAEKSPWRSPAINDAIRLLALEEIIRGRKPDRLRLVSADARLDEALRDLCGSLGVGYEWRRLKRGRRRQLTLAGIFQLLPQPVQAVISLVRLLCARWPLRQTDKAGWLGGDRTVLFCSYFIHLDEASHRQGRFLSRQWEMLPELLLGEGYQTNWLQHYLPTSAVGNAETAKGWIRDFNQQHNGQSFHAFLDAYLSPCVVWRVMYRWMRLNLVHWHLRDVKQAFKPADSGLSLWPVMRRDWDASLRGSVAVVNLLWIELFDAALRTLPRQRQGLYLYEGQSWERAFIHAWRTHDHGQLIGVAHSTVRFWDLRYFADPRTVGSSASGSVPQPDLMALNGRAEIEAYLDAGYPREAFAECEAVRYGYLEKLRPRVVRQQAEHEQIRVLILGDAAPSSTIKLLQLLVAATERMPTRPMLTVKPHPNYMVEAEDYPSLDLTVVIEALGDILHEFDVAYCSPSTSASVDAYLAGLSVLVMLDETQLNLSPLRARSGVRFVSTPDELTEALQSGFDGPIADRDRGEFFFLDAKLPRWKKVLGLESGRPASEVHP